jgi:acyl-coenzyme A synthetase/AMP-(fatty) acid ligase
MLRTSDQEEYLAGGTRRRLVLEAAARLRGNSGRADGALLLVADDKAAIAAALVAAAAGAPRLTAPPGLAPRTLEEVVDSAGMTRALVEGDRETPPAVTRIRLSVDEIGRPAGELPVPDWGRVCMDLYTGGSTGQPKLWAKSAGALFGEAAFLAETYGIGPGDTILSTVPPHHIYGMLFTVLLPLISGARVVGRNPFFPAEVFELAGMHRATVLVGSPVHYKALSAALPSDTKLRLAFSSGGFLDETAAERFEKRVGLGIVEVYGSTETGGIATRCRGQGESSWTPFLPVRFRIEGERFLVSSPFLSAGLPRDKGGFFTTGDRADEAPEAGCFILHGRADGVVKVGGKRVDLEDVRNRILRLPGVKDAYVLALATRTGRENEVAALVECDGDEHALKKAVSEVLEPAAVPRVLRVVRKVPTRTSGKYDREEAIRLLEEARYNNGNGHGHGRGGGGPHLSPGKPSRGRRQA